MSTRIASDFIDELLLRTDLIEIISQRIPLKKKGANHMACCPFHQEKSPSFSANHVKQFYYCFGCGAHGNALKFVMEYDNLSFVDAVEDLAAQASLTLRYDSSSPNFSPAKLHQSTDLYTILDKAQSEYITYLKSSPTAIDYLKSRGITGLVAKAFSIGLAPKAWDMLLKKHPKDKQTLIDAGLAIKNDQGRVYDRFRHRLMFPIHDRRGRTIGFGGRTMVKGETPKYLNSPETAVFIKGRELYGLYEAKKQNRNLDKLLIVEGYMDVISLAQHDIWYAVATLGTATTKEHLKLLFKETHHIIFCFDGDNAGRQAAKRALSTTLPFMTGQFQVKFLFLPEGEDPDSLVQKIGKDSFEQTIANAQSLSDYLLSDLKSTLNLNSVEGKAKFINELKPLIPLIPEGIFLSALIHSLSESIHLDQEKIRRALMLKEPPSYINTTKINKLTLTEVALSHVLQDPMIVFDLNTVKFKPKTKAKCLIGEIIQLINTIKPKTSGVLLQHLVNHKDIEYLMSLASRYYPIIERTIRLNELNDIIDRLNNDEAQEVINDLIEKSKNSGLSPDDKKHLLELLGTHQKSKL